MIFPFRSPEKPGSVFRYKHGCRVDECHPFVYLGKMGESVIVASFVTSQSWHENTPGNLFVKIEPSENNVVINKTSYILVQEVRRFDIEKMKAEYAKDCEVYRFTTECISDDALKELVDKMLTDATVDDDVKQMLLKTIT